MAIAVSLRTAAGGTVTGIGETAVRALVKLDQVLPSRLRRRVAALHDYTVALPPAASAVPADVLVAVTAACRDQHRLRFDYRRHDGTSDVRDVEPYRLVHTGRRWYLVAFDVARQDWRTFRVDRLFPRTPPGPRFTPREAPPADLVPRGVDTALSRLRARVTVRAPAEVIRARVPPAVLVEPLNGESCVVHAGAETPHQLALHILMLDADFVVDGPPELLDALRTVHRRSAVSSAAGPGTGRDARQRTPRGAEDGVTTAGSRLAPPR